MRTLLKVTFEVDSANHAINDGTLPKTIDRFVAKTKPESMYFSTSEGSRAGFFVFDLQDPSEIPSIAEPFFMNLNAKVEFSPVMNYEDLKKGLEKWSKTEAGAAMTS